MVMTYLKILSVQGGPLGRVLTTEGGRRFLIADEGSDGVRDGARDGVRRKGGEGREGGRDGGTPIAP